ncbi:PotD/PotF family extracellular solute-binding protein [Kaistia sp. 32K]|uniref:ABC transporter substrate-binding protein n=1 Tax=Kaistia sp. 32K TaxID=2795690 RepID=UPI001FD20B72|nr:extracellular solute-binding protein [Kaistia sp. 32K]
MVRGFLNDRLNADVSRRRFIQGAAGLATISVLGASAGASAAETPKLGGQLNFLGWDGEHGGNVAKPFLEKNGIQLQASFQSAADEALTRFNTGGRGAMDLLTPNKDFQRAILASNVELFQPLDLARIPTAAGLFPAFKDAPWLVRDGKTYGIPIIWGDEPCVFNPAKWDKMPARYTDFADPKYKGQLVLLDDPFGNIWLYAVSLGMKEPSRLTAAELEQVIEAMLKMKPNVVTIGASHGDMADVLIRGDASIGIGGWAYQTLIAKEKGVKLVVGSPEVDGTFFWSDAYAIAADAPNLDNAYAFIDFMTSTQSNAALAKELGSGCTVEAAYDLLDPSVRDLYPYDNVRKPGGGILGTQIVVPPQENDGDIVGAPAWVEAWQTFKAS